MIKKLIARYRDKKLEKELNKPKYEIDQLWIGELIYLEDKKHLGPRNYYTYRVKKKYVLLTLDGFASYRHIKTGCIIRSSLMAPIGDFAIHNDIKLNEHCPILLRKLYLDAKSKISYNMVSALEESLNNDQIEHLKNANSIIF